MARDSLHEYDDQELLATFARTRDNRYFAEIERRYRRGVQAGAYAVLRDNDLAKDVAQECFLRVYLNAEKLTHGPLNLASWLYVVTKNLALRSLRKSRRELSLDDGGYSEEMPVVPSLDGLLDADEVVAILEQLSRPQRICLKLFYLKGMRYKEIADRTGYPESSVKSYVQNGRLQFKKVWNRLQRTPHER